MSICIGKTLSKYIIQELKGLHNRLNRRGALPEVAAGILCLNPIVAY